MLKRLLPAVILAALLPAAHAQSGPAAELLTLVNHWRDAPATCQGRTRAAVPTLKPVPLLSRVALRQGTILLAVLDAAGYDAEVADAVQVTGPSDARAAFDALREAYCARLSSTRYADIGAHVSGNEWTVVLGRTMPNPELLLPALAQAEQEVLEATNAARAVGRDCGGLWMVAAPPVRYNARLAAAALAHSQDMARHSYFAHADQDGRDVSFRTREQGYRWKSVAENIARGQTSAREAVDSWINSPGHCRALMDARFTEMGSAYAIRSGQRPAAYWTQVFATSR